MEPGAEQTGFEFAYSSRGPAQAEPLLPEEGGIVILNRCHLDPRQGSPRAIDDSTRSVPAIKEQNLSPESLSVLHSPVKLGSHLSLLDGSVLLETKDMRMGFQSRHKKSC